MPKIERISHAKQTKRLHNEQIDQTRCIDIFIIKQRNKTCLVSFYHVSFIAKRKLFMKGKQNTKLSYRQVLLNTFMSVNKELAASQGEKVIFEQRFFSIEVHYSVQHTEYMNFEFAPYLKMIGANIYELSQILNNNQLITQAPTSTSTAVIVCREVVKSLQSVKII